MPHPMQAAGHRDRGRSRRGYAILWCLVTLILILTFGALAMELAWIRSAQTQARTAAEAAALAAAGALDLGREEAAFSASEIAARNPGPSRMIELIATADNASEDLVFGRWDGETRVFEETLLMPDSVRARVVYADSHPNGSVEMLLAGVLSRDEVEFSTDALAQRRPDPDVPVSLIVTNPIRSRRIDLRGADLNVNGEIEVRSTSEIAVRCLQNAGIVATTIDNRGGYSLDSDDVVRAFVVDATDAIPPNDVVIDPSTLEIREEVVDGPATFVLSPGHYPDGLSASQGQYVLEAGIYHFGGPGLILTGGATLTGNEVLIRITGDGALRLEGATMNVTTAEVVGGIANPERIAVSLDTTLAVGIELFSSASLSVDGTIHAAQTSTLCRESNLAATRLVTEGLRGRQGASIEIGPDDPHPVRVRIVR